MRKKPNIIFVFADQLRADALGCYGNEEVLTPHMDQLAREGVLCSHAIANSPVCGPSRASLLTGTYPLAHKVLHNDLPIDVSLETVGTVLKRNGYRTGYIGKWHLDGMPRDKFTPPGPRRLGFDDYWAVYNCAHDYYRTRYYLDTPELIGREQYEPDHQTDLAISCLDAWKEQEQPFCLFLSWGPPHDPYDQVPEHYKALYDKPITARANCLQPDTDTIKNYYAAVTALDRNLGRIMNFLQETGLEEETILVFTSDHGDMLYSHGMQQKQLPYEESIRIPLIIRWKARLAPAVSETLIGIADFTPTLLGLVGIGKPVNMQGADVSPAWLSGRDAPRESVPIMNIVPRGKGLLFGERLPWRGVRTGQFTFAVFQDQPWILYDHKQDPYQLHNLIDSPGSEPLIRELRQELEGWLDALGDPFLVG